MKSNSCADAIGRGVRQAERIVDVGHVLIAEMITIVIIGLQLVVCFFNAAFPSPYLPRLPTLGQDWTSFLHSDVPQKGAKCGRKLMFVRWLSTENRDIWVNFVMPACDEDKAKYISFEFEYGRIQNDKLQCNLHALVSSVWNAAKRDVLLVNAALPLTCLASKPLGLCGNS